MCIRDSGWGSSTICNILEKREYLGHTINFKTRKHFKDKKSHYVPADEWTIFENTHESIIDQQTFDLVQKIRVNVRRYPDEMCIRDRYHGLQDIPKEHKVFSFPKLSIREQMAAYQEIIDGSSRCV